MVEMCTRVCTRVGSVRTIMSERNPGKDARKLRFVIYRPGGNHQSRALPDSLTREQILAGRSNRRNKVLAEHAAHILPYRGLGTGIPRAVGVWPRIELIDEPEGNQFKAVLWRTDTGQVTGQVLRLLSVMNSEHSRTNLQSMLRLKHRDSFMNAYLQPAIQAGFIEMTIPDKPNSRLQKYRLTDYGRALLASKNNTRPRR